MKTVLQESERADILARLAKVAASPESFGFAVVINATDRQIEFFELGPIPSLGAMLRLMEAAVEGTNALAAERVTVVNLDNGDNGDLH